MSHMVIFNGTEGQPRYHQADTLEDAVKFAEHLRNAEDLDNTKIYKLSEVVFEFRPYFRVEVGAAADEASEAESSEPGSVEVEEVVADLEDLEDVKPEEKAEEKPAELEQAKDRTEQSSESDRAESPKSSRIFSRS